MIGKTRDRIRERVLIVGLAAAANIVAQIAARPRDGWRVVGIVDDEPVTGPVPPGCPVLGPLSRLADIVNNIRPDRVVIGLTERRGRIPVPALVESCVAQGIAVEDAADFSERLTGKLAIESLSPTSLVCSKKFGPSRFHGVFARVLSLLVAIAGLMLLSPLIALIALAVKLDSQGPLLFVHLRVGRGGQPFKLLKFRTMHPARDQHSEWERDNRDRVTRVGRWLRKFRLDELPQFINVVRGEMNLVGPRPHPVSNFELFTVVARNVNELTGAPVGYYTLRTMIRPGITGWAQVRYRYANDLEEEIEKLRYDLFYVKHISAALDLRILLETVRVVLFGHAKPAAPAAAARPVTPAPAPLALRASVNQTHAA